MEKKLVSYETMYIVDCTGTEEATAALVNKFKTLIGERHDRVLRRMGKAQARISDQRFDGRLLCPRELQSRTGLCSGA